MRDLTSNSDLNALKVPELKEELEVRGAMDKKYKLKKDLIDALHKVFPGFDIMLLCVSLSTPLKWSTYLLQNGFVL